jgi:hypothetical protein
MVNTIGKWLPITLAGLAILFVLVVVLMIIRNAGADTASQPDQPAVLPGLLGTPQHVEDTFPTGMSFPDILSDTTRLLATRDNKRYWAGYNEEGNICIISHIAFTDGDFSSASGCNEVEHFLDHGVFVTLHTNNEYTAAVLFPEGYQQRVADLLPNADLAQNLIILNQTNRESMPGGELTIPPDAGAATQDELELIIPLP